MGGGIGAKAGYVLAVVGLSALAGCSSTPGESGMGLSDMVLLAGTTMPAPKPQEIEGVYCPPVEVAAGGSAIQTSGGGQVALGQLARECIGQPDGSTLVKIGLEARALLGSGGSARRYDVPVQVVVKRGSAVIANRSRRMSVAIPAGDTQTIFSVVEDNIAVPAAHATTFEIQVGLGGRRG